MIASPVDTVPQPADDAATATDAYVERAARAAEQLGIASTAVQPLPFDLSILAEQGLFLDVTASGSGLLSTQLGWEPLGVVIPPDAQPLFRPPRCLLLPERYHQPIERLLGAAHDLLRRYSFRFRLVEAVIGSTAYRWVPATAIVRFHTEFRNLQAQLEVAKQEVLAHYDQIVAAGEATFVRLAGDSAQRLLATGQAVPDDFDERVLAAFRTAMPSPDAIRDRIALRLDVGVFKLGSEMAAEQQRTLQARRQLQVEHLETERQVRAVQAALFAEEEERARAAEAATLMHQLRVEAERRLMEEMVQQQLSPLAEAAQQLHEETVAVARAVTAALRKHGHLPGSSHRQVRRLADYLKLMNFQSDEGLAQLITALEERAQALKTAGRRRRQAAAGAPAAEALAASVTDLVAYTRQLVDLHGGRAAAVEL